MTLESARDLGCIRSLRLVSKPVGQAAQTAVYRLKLNLGEEIFVPHSSSGAVQMMDGVTRLFEHSSLKVLEVCMQVVDHPLAGVGLFEGECAASHAAACSSLLNDVYHNPPCMHPNIWLLLCSKS